MTNNSMSFAQNLALAREIQQISAIRHSPTTKTLARSPQLADPFACHRCGVIDVPRITPGKGPHAYAAQCASCNAFIRWVSRSSSAERETMAQKPTSQLQPFYIKAHDHDGRPPATMAEASVLIEHLKVAKGVL